MENLDLLNPKETPEERQATIDQLVSLVLPAWELFDFSCSVAKSSEGFEWGDSTFDHIGNNNEFKTTLGVQYLLGYAYSIKHNVKNDNPVKGSLVHAFSFGPIFYSSSGAFGITLSYALIGGISISITGNIYYEGN